MQQQAIVQACFNAIVQLRDPGCTSPCADDVHELLTHALTPWLQQAPGGARHIEHDDGAPRAAEAADSAYAIVALADELALRGAPEVARAWQPRMLQAQLFGEWAAGEGFFVRLEGVRAGGRARRETLSIYYTALALGFEGRMGTGDDRHALAQLIAAVRTELCGPELDDAPLSPHPLALRADAATGAAHEMAGRKMWGAWLALVVASGAMVLAAQGAQHVRAQQVAQLAAMRALQTEAVPAGPEGAAP